MSYPQYPESPPPERPGQPSTDKGFFGALFDYSFESVVTPKIVSFAYVLLTVMLALSWLALIITGFAAGAGEGIVALILGGVIFFVYLIVARMGLEVFRAVVVMASDIREMKNRQARM